MNKQEITFKREGIIAFNTSIGSKVVLIKSMHADIVTLSQRKRTDTTYDKSDIKILVDWLIEQGMYKHGT